MAARLTRVGWGTPEESVLTVGGSVTAFFTTLNVDAIWSKEEVEGEKLAGRGKFRDRPTNEHDGAGEQSIH